MWFLNGIVSVVLEGKALIEKKERRVVKVKIEVKPIKRAYFDGIYGGATGDRISFVILLISFHIVMNRTLKIDHTALNAR